MRDLLRLLWRTKRMEIAFQAGFYTLFLFVLFLWLGWSEAKKEPLWIVSVFAIALPGGAIGAVGSEPWDSFEPERERKIAQLVTIYRENPQGFVVGAANRPEVAEIRRIGEQLNAEGGMELMRIVHKSFADRRGVLGAPRNLEHLWGGTGRWQG